MEQQNGFILIMHTKQEKKGANVSALESAKES